ncbi:MAG: hypothetical protein AAGD38_22575 [Acidobacteriota bacterium]
MRILDLSTLSDTLRHAVDSLDGEPILIVRDGHVVARLDIHPPAERRQQSGPRHQVAGTINIQGDLVVNVEGDVIAPIEPQEGWEIENEFELGDDYDDFEDDDDFYNELMEDDDEEEDDESDSDEEE